MESTLNSFPEKMARLRHTVQKDDREIEFWSAREIQEEFGYADWPNFVGIIEKAMVNCSNVGEDPKHHFGAITKMVPIGSGALREQIDYALSRTACYLIALNGEAGKQEIAWAKAYFIVQTKLREQEAATDLNDAEERERLRLRLKEANKLLAMTAKGADVQNFAFFHDTGIRALYRLKMSDLKAKKGVAADDDYWDHVGGLELSANEFKAQLARKTISQKGSKIGQRGAEIEHEKAGKAVRATVHKETGVHLEDLPLEPSLREPRKLKRLATKKTNSTLGEPSSSETLPPA
jgi:DNA-damage-inducible protein D